MWNQLFGVAAGSTEMLDLIIPAVLVSDFNYHLPPELIAQEPLEDRASSRLLRVRRDTGELSDGTFRDFPRLLRSGDLVVFNNTRVFPARLYGRRSDAESINRGLEDSLYLRRAHSVGHARQHVNLLGYALMVNSLALDQHHRRQPLSLAA